MAEPVRQGEGDQHQRQHTELVQADRQPVLADQQVVSQPAAAPIRSRPHRLASASRVWLSTSLWLPRRTASNTSTANRAPMGSMTILPAQDLVHLPHRPDHVEHGGDHGGAGDHQHGAEHHGDPPVQPEQEVAGHTDDGEAGQHAHRTEVAHHLADPLEFGQVQGQRPFEQDDGDREETRGKQQLPATDPGRARP